jgi:putative transcriptional regulator
MNYPELIKHIRENLLLSQTELAVSLGVSFATINRWENGHHIPIMRDRRKIRELCIKNGIKEE